MGNMEVDVERLTLKSLHNYLWKSFLPPHVSVRDQDIDAGMYRTFKYLI